MTDTPLMNIKVYKDKKGKIRGIVDYSAMLDDEDREKLCNLMKHFSIPEKSQKEPSDMIWEDTKPDLDEEEELPKTEDIKTDAESTFFLLKEYVDYNAKIEYVLKKQSEMNRQLLGMLIESGKITAPRRPYWGGNYFRDDD